MKGAQELRHVQHDTSRLTILGSINQGRMLTATMHLRWAEYYKHLLQAT